VDVLGRFVSISGDTVIVGAPGDDDSGSDSGSAYVFEKPESGWANMTETAKLSASDGAAQDEFGAAASISGDTVVVGAPYHDDSGSAYLFEKPEAGWTGMTETAKLGASDPEWDLFGRSVSISGDTVIVGAPLDDDNGIYSGSAYLFEKPEAGWTDMTETAKLSATDNSVGDQFGQSVSISDDTMVLGAPYDNDGGSACVFELDEGGQDNWGEVAKLTASDSAAGDSFGYSVSISGDTVVVGAYGDDDSGSGSGSAYLFREFEPIAWVYMPVVLRSAP
jgi:hypothetical protein